MSQALGESQMSHKRLGKGNPLVSCKKLKLPKGVAMIDKKSHSCIIFDAPLEHFPVTIQIN